MWFPIAAWWRGVAWLAFLGSTIALRWSSSVTLYVYITESGCKLTARIGCYINVTTTCGTMEGALLIL